MISPLLRLALWAVCIALWISGSIAWLWLLRGPRILDSDPLLIGGWCALSIFPILVYLLLRTTPPDALKLPRRSSGRIIIAGSILLNILAFAWIWPGLTEDLIRYRHDALMLRNRVSPYAQSPMQFANQHLEGRDLLDRMIVHSDYRSIYPPTSQLIFLIARFLEPSSDIHAALPAENWRDALPNLRFSQRVAVLRLFAGIASVLSTVLLLAILNHLNLSSWYASLFAWHPLVIMEFGGQGHQDIYGIALLLAAMLSYLAYVKRRQGLSAVAMALACGVKPMVGILIPYFIRFKPRYRFMIPFLIAAGALSLSFLWQGGYHGWTASIRRYSQSWEFNGSTYEAIKHLFKQFDTDGYIFELGKYYARLFGVGMVLLIGLKRWRDGSDPMRAGYSILLTMLLVAPVAYPWSAAWFLALLPLARVSTLAGLVYAGTLSLSYRVWHLPDWQIPGSLAAIEYTPVFIALTVDYAINRATRPPAK